MAESAERSVDDETWMGRKVRRVQSVDIHSESCDGGCPWPPCLLCGDNPWPQCRSEERLLCLFCEIGLLEGQEPAGRRCRGWRCGQPIVAFVSGREFACAKHVVDYQWRKGVTYTPSWKKRAKSIPRRRAGRTTPKPAGKGGL